jgi:prepilin-type N-terminal cleavage/methylation domain-containing protein
MTFSFLRKTRRGFTLPEVLVVVGILSILAVIAIVAIDPVSRFEDARNSRRLSDIQAIAGVLHQYTIDHKGVFPSGLNNQERQIGTASSGCSLITDECSVKEDSCLDLTAAITPYLHGVPNDPSGGTREFTRYSVRIGDNNAIIVRACDLTERQVE